MSALLATVLVVAVLAAPLHGQTAPDWPQQWTRGGTQNLVRPLPPFDGDIAPLPAVNSVMSAAYDWSIKALRETYQDVCVPIFPAGSMWSCDFVNVNGTAYLLQHEDRAPDQPECCIFLDPWHPPAPTFAADSLYFLKNTTGASGVKVMWWQSQGVTPAEGGPFGYGWSLDANTQELSPYAFYFGAFWHYANGTNSGGYTIQYYSDFEPNKPPPETWHLPESCATAKKCSNWPNLNDAKHPYYRI